MAFYEQDDPYAALGATVSQPRRPPPMLPSQGGYGRVVTGGPRVAPPVAPSQMTQDYASANNANANANQTQAMLPGQLTQQQLQVQQLQRDLQQGASPQQVNQNDLARQRADIEAMTQQLQTVGNLYNRNFRDNDPIISLGLSPTEREFDRNAGILRQQAQSAFRVPGVGSQSDYEARQLEDAYGVDSRNWDTENEAILTGITNRLNERRQALGLPPVDWRQSATPDPNRVQPGESMGQVGNLPPLIDSEREQQAGGNQLDNAGGLYATEQDRQRASQIASHATAMARGGASPEQINQWLLSQGIQGMPASDAQLLNSYRQRRRTREFPGFSPNVIPTGRSDPNLTTGLANTGLGAAVIGGGDALLMGTLDNLTADPERTRAGMEMLREQHPVAAAVGEAAGSLLPGTALERAAAMGLRGLNGARGVQTLARAPGQMATLGEMSVRPLGNAAYGAGYGAGSNDGNRLRGAIEGAGMSVLGGEVGDRATAGLGRAATGARNASVRALAARGVPLTIGDIAGQGGAFGRGVSRVQNVLESVPALGDAIRGRRADANRAFNRSVFEDALKPIGGSTNGIVGSEGVDIARNAVSDAYSSALDTVKVTADQPFVRAMNGVLRVANRMPPDLKTHFDSFIANRVSQFMANGQLSGRAFQALRQEIRQDINAASGQLGEGAYRNALKRTEAVLSGLVRRHSPQTRQALRAADQAFRGSRIVEGGVNRAINNDAPGVFTPAQLGMEARQNANRYGGNAATTARPFYQLQRDAQTVLPSRLPNSGTADRSWVLQTFPAIAAGTAYQLGFLDPKTAALFAGLGIPYTRTGQRAFQKLLVSRPDRVRQIGEAIIARHGIGSDLGAGAINPLTDQTPSPSGR